MVCSWKAFESCHKKDHEKLPIPDLIDFCVMHPEIKSWLEYYNDADEAELTTYHVNDNEIDYQEEAQVSVVVVVVVAVVVVPHGCFTRVPHRPLTTSLC